MDLSGKHREQHQPSAHLSSVNESFIQANVFYSTWCGSEDVTTLSYIYNKTEKHRLNISWLEKDVLWLTQTRYLRAFIGVLITFGQKLILVRSQNIFCYNCLQLYWNCIISMPVYIRLPVKTRWNNSDYKRSLFCSPGWNLLYQK